MNLELAPFLAILRRSTRCGFSSVIMNNHMLMQCYNLDIDSDVGLNYVLHIPEDKDPFTEFYDLQLEFKPREILSAYSKGHKELAEIRASQGLKPKAATETVEYKVHHDRVTLTFRYYLVGEEKVTSEVDIPYPLNESSVNVENCAKSYNKLVDRIKPGGVCLAFDGIRLGLQPRIIETPEIYRFRVKYGGKRILIPFAKSMFLGIKDVDTFLFSIQESNMEGIYVLSITIGKKDIIEEFWGYVIQY